MVGKPAAHRDRLGVLSVAATPAGLSSTSTRSAAEDFLGAVLLDPEILKDVPTRLTADHFPDEKTRAVFAAINKLSRSGSPFTYNDVMAATGDDLAAEDYIGFLMAGIGSPATAPHHAGLLDKALKRADIRTLVDELERRIDENPNFDPASIAEVGNAGLSKINDPTPPPPALKTPSTKWPEHLLKLPGWGGEIMDHMSKTATYPNRPLELAATLALGSFLFGRTVQTESGLRSNLMIVGLGYSGVGKDNPRKVVSDIITRSGLGTKILSFLASREGLEDAIHQDKALLLLPDEFDGMLEAHRRDKTGRWALITGMLMQVFTSAGSCISKRRLANGGGGELLVQPHLTMLATATPEAFWRSLDAGLARGGFIPRLFIVEAGKKGARQSGKAQPVPDHIIDIAKNVSVHLDDDEPTTQTIVMDSAARDEVEHHRDRWDGEHATATNRRDNAACALWARSGETCLKLAMLHALFEDPLAETIHYKSAAWAAEVADAHTRLLIDRAAENVSESPFDSSCKKLLKILRDLGGAGQRRDVQQRFKAKKQDLDAVLDHLIEIGKIRESRRKTARWYAIL